MGLLQENVEQPKIDCSYELVKITKTNECSIFIIFSETLSTKLEVFEFQTLTK